jgi:O-antigen ligase
MTNQNLLLNVLFVFAISTFILSILYFSGIVPSQQIEGRFTIFGMNQNLLGLCLCISSFIIISIIFENSLKLGRKRLLLISLLPFLFIFMIITGSRVAFLSFFLGIISYLFFNNKITRTKKVFLVLFTFILFILVWLIFLKNSLVIERLSDTVNRGDLSSRDLIWIDLFNIISNNFLFGVGKTGYALAVGEGSPHNVLIEVLCYTGIVGLLIFSIFFYRIVNNAYKRIKYNNELLPIILTIPILGMILSGQIFDQKIVWVIFAYIVSNTVIKKKQAFNKINT